MRTTNTATAATADIPGKLSGRGPTPGGGTTKPGPSPSPAPGSKPKPGAKRRGRTVKSIDAGRRRKILLGAAAVATAVGVGLWLGIREANAAELGQPARKKPALKRKGKNDRKKKGKDSKGKGKGEGKGKGKGDGKDKGGDGARGPKTPKGPLEPKAPKDGKDGGGDEKGPNPRTEDLHAYYSETYPDPGVFYQVSSGGADAKGLEGIARRWLLSSLFLAAQNAGDLDDVAAVAWAQNTITDALVREAMDYILCTAWNDVIYGSFRVAKHNRRGPHGRGIDLVPQHADNWTRISQGREALRNVRLHQAGDVGTPRNVGKGDRRLPLLWMPRLSDRALWESEGTRLKAGGSWGDGSSLYFPPPVVMNAAIEDPTSAGLGAWGCGAGSFSYA